MYVLIYDRLVLSVWQTLTGGRLVCEERAFLRGLLEQLQRARVYVLTPDAVECAVEAANRLPQGLRSRAAPLTSLVDLLCQEQDLRLATQGRCP
jgi:hypothetical protein